MKQDIKVDLADLDTAYLIEELYLRKVSIKDIFGRYYEFEIASDGHSMYVEDANYAGMTEPSDINQETF